MTQTDRAAEQATIWLTQDAYDKLREELAELKGPVLSEIVARIGAARAEGDLSENAGYHAAKDEHGKISARIKQLEHMLDQAKVGETPPDDGVVEPGMLVTARFAGEKDTETFLLGAREMAKHSDDLTVYSPQSPLGAAINGKKRGETVSYDVNGRTHQVEILDAVPYPG